jgi:hypothetical protein
METAASPFSCIPEWPLASLSLSHIPRPFAVVLFCWELLGAWKCRTIFVSIICIFNFPNDMVIPHMEGDAVVQRIVLGKLVGDQWGGEGSGSWRR